MIAINRPRRDDDAIGDLAGDLADLEHIERVVVNRGDYNRDWLDVVVDAQTIHSPVLGTIAGHGCSIAVVSTTANHCFLTITEEPR